MAIMARLLILWHSLTGGSRQMAQAAADGAGAECEVMMIAAREAEAAHLLETEGYLFVAPENLASLAGVTKDFFDRTYYPLLGRIEGRPYAAMICAGTDGEGAARQMARIATGWRLRAVAEPLIVRTGAQTPEAILASKTIDASDLSLCRDRGAMIAAGLALGIF